MVALIPFSSDTLKRITVEGSSTSFPAKDRIFGKRACNSSSNEEASKILYLAILPSGIGIATTTSEIAPT